MSRKNQVDNWIEDLTTLYKGVRTGKEDLDTVKTAIAVSGQVLKFMRFEHARVKKSKKAA